MRNLHIIVPLYGRLDYFRELVRSLEVARTPETTVIVYYDGPADPAARAMVHPKPGFLMYFGDHVGIAHNLSRAIDKSVSLDPEAVRVLLASDHRVPANFCRGMLKVADFIGDQSEIGHIHHTPGSEEFQREWSKGAVAVGEGVSVATGKSLSYLCSMPSMIVGSAAAIDLARFLREFRASAVESINVSRLFLSYWGMRTCGQCQKPFAITGASVEHLGHGKHPDHIRTVEHKDYYAQMKHRKAPVGPLSPHYYDDLFKTGGSQKAYHNPIEGNMYEAIWKAIIEQVKDYRSSLVLELGCGSGALAEGLLKADIVEYLGIDFSPVAIEMARARCKEYLEFATFLVGDVHLPIYHQSSYTDFVATEVFEHVEDDVRIARNIRSKARVHLSLPNFTTKSHIRTYAGPQAISSRFAGILKFSSFRPFKRIGVDEGSDRIVWVCEGVRL
jgi:SAM-dependent methyltransferase